MKRSFRFRGRVSRVRKGSSSGLIKKGFIGGFLLRMDLGSILWSRFRVGLRRLFRMRGIKENWCQP